MQTLDILNVYLAMSEDEKCLLQVLLPELKNPKHLSTDKKRCFILKPLEIIEASDQWTQSIDQAQKILYRFANQLQIIELTNNDEFCSFFMEKQCIDDIGVLLNKDVLDETQDLKDDKPPYNDNTMKKTVPIEVYNIVQELIRIEQREACIMRLKETVTKVARNLGFSVEFCGTYNIYNVIIRKYLLGDNIPDVEKILILKNPNKMKSEWKYMFNPRVEVVSSGKTLMEEKQEGKQTKHRGPYKRKISKTESIISKDDNTFLPSNEMEQIAKMAKKANKSDGMMFDPHKQIKCDESSSQKFVEFVRVVSWYEKNPYSLYLGKHKDQERFILNIPNLVKDGYLPKDFNVNAAKDAIRKNIGVVLCLRESHDKEINLVLGREFFEPYITNQMEIVECIRLMKEAGLLKDVTPTSWKFMPQNLKRIAWAKEYIQYLTGKIGRRRRARTLQELEASVSVVHEEKQSSEIIANKSEMLMERAVIAIEKLATAFEVIAKKMPAYRLVPIEELY